jgi:hypothetical protein
MSCNPTEAQSSLLWALKTGRDDGDSDFENRRNKMIAAATNRDVTTLAQAGYDMFKRHHEQEGINIQACGNETPQDLLRWARDILGLGP